MPPKKIYNKDFDEDDEMVDDLGNARSLFFIVVKARKNESVNIVWPSREFIFDELSKQKKIEMLIVALEKEDSPNRHFHIFFRTNKNMVDYSFNIRLIFSSNNSMFYKDPRIVWQWIDHICPNLFQFFDKEITRNVDTAIQYVTKSDHKLLYKNITTNKFK